MKNEFILNDKKFRAFCIYRLLFGISYSIMIPIIPLFFKSIGMETVTIGMVISLYGVSKTIMQIPFGIVCDKIGDKLTLKLALLLMGWLYIIKYKPSGRKLICYSRCYSWNGSTCNLFSTC